MKEPLISIVTPVYCVEQFLPKCLNSILTQSFSDWECILIDDGSIDNCGAICDSFVAKDSRFRVFHKKNGGVSAARNLGIKEAKGEWVTFIDADDFVGETYIHGLLQPVLQENKVDFVHGGCTNYENGQITSVNQEYDYFVGHDKGKLFSSFRGLVVSKLFKTEILHQHNLFFDEEMKIAEDMAFTMDYLFYVNSYALVPEKGYYYRRDNEGSATHIIKWMSYQQARKSFMHLYKATVDYVSENSIKDSDSLLRFKQRASQYYHTLRTMYHDNSITRSQRLRILRNDSIIGLFELFRYVEPNDSCYLASQNLLKRRFVYFDIRQLFAEKIEQLKSCLKTTIELVCSNRRLPAIEGQYKKYN